MSTAEAAPRISLSAARKHIQLLFGPLLVENALEKRGNFLIARGSDWAAALFPLTHEGVQRALDTARRWNEQGERIYIKPGVIAKDFSGAPKMIRDEHIIGHVAFWIDCDKPKHFEALNEFSEFEPTFHVITGATPTLRRQSYFMLEKPVANDQAWDQASRDLTAYFGTDPTVRNASTYMRLAGFVAWPPTTGKKASEGRVPELVRIEDGSGEAVSLETIQTTFQGAEAAHRAELGDNVISAPERFHQRPWEIDAGGPKWTTPRIVAALQAAQEAGQWHVNVRDAVAGMVGLGYTDVAIHAMTVAYGRADGGLSDGDVDALIRGARQKWHVPDPGGYLVADQPEHGLDLPDVVTAAEFVDALEPPDFLISDMVQRRYFYTLTAPTGTGKTAVAQTLALSVATGRALGGRQAHAGRVLYLAGENPDNERSRLLVASELLGVPLGDLSNLFFHAGTFDIARDMALIAEAAEQRGGFDLVVVDTVAAYFRVAGLDENSNTEMGRFAATLRALTTLPGEPAVLAPSHPTKGARGDEEMVPRGGGAFIAEVDGNFQLSGDGETIVMQPGKMRGPKVEPFAFELRLGEAIIPKHNALISNTIAVPISDERAEAFAARALDDAERLIVDMAMAPEGSFRERCERLGWLTPRGEPSKGKVQRLLQRLDAHGLVRNTLRGWRLTSSGEDEAAQLQGAGR